MSGGNLFARAVAFANAVIGVFLAVAIISLVAFLMYWSLGGRDRRF